MLTGSQPFIDDNLQKLVDKIKNEEPQYNLKIFDKITNEAKDLLKLMLQKDPSHRPSAQECLQHTWISLGCDEQLNIKIRREYQGLQSTAERLNERMT